MIDTIVSRQTITIINATLKIRGFLFFCSSVLLKNNAITNIITTVKTPIAIAISFIVLILKLKMYV